MDPQANLMEQLRISQDIQQTTNIQELINLGDRLADLVIALNAWIQGGGFLPQDWNQK